MTPEITGQILLNHYGDVIMGAIASQITSLTIVCSIVYSDADQRKHQSSASLAFVWGIHRGQMASNAENASIWWRHHDNAIIICPWVRGFRPLYGKVTIVFTSNLMYSLVGWYFRNESILGNLFSIQYWQYCIRTMSCKLSLADWTPWSNTYDRCLLSRNRCILSSCTCIYIGSLHTGQVIRPSIYIVRWALNM